MTIINLTDNLFFSSKALKISATRADILARKERKFSPGFNKTALFINVGDYVEIFYFYKGNLFSFDGLCLSIRLKSLIKPNVSLVVRNKIQNVWIECSFSYFYNRIYNLKVLDYKRKFFSFNHSKWFFLRKSKISSVKKNQKLSWYLSRGAY